MFMVQMTLMGPGSAQSIHLPAPCTAEVLCVTPVYAQQGSRATVNLHGATILNMPDGFSNRPAKPVKNETLPEVFSFPSATN